MIKRTTFELDTDLLERARVALRAPSMKAAIEESLRRVVVDSESVVHHSVTQLGSLISLLEHADLDVMASDEMWR